MAMFTRIPISVHCLKVKCLKRIFTPGDSLLRDQWTGRCLLTHFTVYFHFIATEHHFKTWNFFIIQKHDTFCCRNEMLMLMQKSVLWKLVWKLINPYILPHIIWNTSHVSSGSVIWFLWIWFNLSNGRNMMDHMLPLVD